MQSLLPYALVVPFIYVLWTLYVKKTDKRFVHCETGKPMPGPAPSFLGINGLVVYMKGSGETLSLIYAESYNGLVRWCRPYGPVCRVFVGPFVWVIVTEHEQYQTLFHKSKTFHRGIFNEAVAQLTPGALFVTEGQIWRKHRLALGPFFSEKEMSKYANHFAQITRTEFDRLPEGKPFKVSTLTSRVTSKVLMKSLFHYTFEEHPDGEKLQSEALNAIGSGSSWLIALYVIMPFIAKLSYFKKIKDNLHKPFLKIAETVKQNSNGQTLWDNLEHLSGEKFTWEEFQYESLGLLMAGFETTSTSLSWVLWSVDKYPTCKEKLQKEITEVLGDRFPNVEDLEKMPYLDKFILECFRFHGPIMVLNRVAVANDTLDGFRVPVGTQVFTSLNQVVRNTFENPDEFNPERFSGENYEKLSKIALTGFGTGPHVCVGKHLALLELKLIASYLIQTDQLKVDLDTAYVHPRSPVNAPQEMTATKISKK